MKNKILRAVKLIGISVIIFIFIISLILNFTLITDEPEEAYGGEPAENECNVYGIEMHGYAITYTPNEEEDEEGNTTSDTFSSENVVLGIREANADDDVKAILLEVDSYGGDPVSAEEIADAVKHSDKPVIAQIRSAGTSAAYWAVSGADHIIALPSSDVGGIGVTFSYLDNTEQNKKEGLTYNQLSMGKFKDTGDPNKTLTYEERQLLMRDVKIINDNFIDAISKNREVEKEKVRVLADGSSMLGQMALENKLIDQIGTFNDVENYLKELIKEEVSICW